jgi:hypothetical protein
VLPIKNTFSGMTKDIITYIPAISILQKFSRNCHGTNVFYFKSMLLILTSGMYAKN